MSADRIAELERELAACESRNEVRRGELDAYEEQNEQLRRELAATQEVCERRRDRAKQAERDLEAARQVIRVLESDASHLSAELEWHRRKLEMVRHAMEADPITGEVRITRAEPDGGGE